MSDWGSCQYEGAVKVFDQLRGAEQSSGRMGACQRVGIKVGGNPANQNSLLRVSNQVIDDEKQARHDYGELTHDEPVPESFESFDEIFEWLRDEAWDLWSTAPYLGQLVFPDLELPEDLGENPLTGFWCFWLLSNHVVSSEDCFIGFST